MTWDALAAGALPLVGVLLGARLTSRQDSRRWQRDWMLERIQEMRAFAAEACLAMDRQTVVLGQAADAIRGNRTPIPHARVEAADSVWAAVLARRYVYGSHELQQALSNFDGARADVATAGNAGDLAALAVAESAIVQARLAVLDAVQDISNSANEVLAGLLVPKPVLLWNRLRHRPVSPRGARPSEMS